MTRYRPRRAARWSPGDIRLARLRTAGRRCRRAPSPHARRPPAPRSSRVRHRGRGPPAPPRRGRQLRRVIGDRHGRRPSLRVEMPGGHPALAGIRGHEDKRRPSGVALSDGDLPSCGQQKRRPLRYLVGAHRPYLPHARILPLAGTSGTSRMIPRGAQRTVGASGRRHYERHGQRRRGTASGTSGRESAGNERIGDGEMTGRRQDIAVCGRQRVLPRDAADGGAGPPCSWLFARILPATDRFVSRITGRRLTFVGAGHRPPGAHADHDRRRQARSEPSRSPTWPAAVTSS